MTTPIREGHLEFTFDDTWTVILKWDDTPSYKHGLRDQVEGSKAVDFACLRGGDVFLIEAKDYRGSEHDPATKKKLRDGGEDLVSAVACKVRDTVAGLVGAARLARDDDATALAQALAARRSAVVAVMWIEHAAPPATVKPKVQALRNKARGGVESDRLQAAVRWLGARALICSRADANHIPGLDVRSLHGAIRRP